MNFSYLFVPGDRSDRFDKAIATGAHVVVLDLEDGVKPESKDAARADIARWLNAGGRAALRVNGTETEWYDGDCALLSHPGVSVAMLPKAEQATDLAGFVARTRPGCPVVPIIETALGLWNVRDLATVRGIERLAFGSVDFQLDTGIVAEGDALLYARSQMVLASAIGGLVAPIDGVSIELDDLSGLDGDISYAKGLGFGGKLCIHPRQIAPVNTGFAPSEAEISWARRVVAVADATGAAGAIRLDGKLIDRPVVERARLVANAAH